MVGSGVLVEQLSTAYQPQAWLTMNSCILLLLWRSLLFCDPHLCSTLHVGWGTITLSSSTRPPSVSVLCVFFYLRSKWSSCLTIEGTWQSEVLHCICVGRTDNTHKLTEGADVCWDEGILQEMQLSAQEQRIMSALKFSYFSLHYYQLRIEGVERKAIFLLLQPQNEYHI